MTKPIHLYSGLVMVFGLSVTIAWLIPASEFVRGMIITPGIGALFGVLVQLARDSASFERQKYLQSDEQIFSLGALSHMANAAFDKHVDFCEAYMSEVHETVAILFRDGPTEEAKDCANRLFALKRKYAAWITKGMALKLEPFEDALHKIGIETQLIAAYREDQQEARSEAIDRSYAIFVNLMGLGKLKDTDPDQKKEVAVENVKEEVRSILGINELTEIRNFIIQRSVSFVRKPPA